MDPAFMVLEPSGLSNCRPCLTWEGHELGPWDNSHDWTVAYVNRFIETNNQPKFSLVRISLMCHAGLDIYIRASFPSFWVPKRRNRTGDCRKAQ